MNRKKKNPFFAVRQCLTICTTIIVTFLLLMNIGRVVHASPHQASSTLDTLEPGSPAEAAHPGTTILAVRSDQQEGDSGEAAGDQGSMTADERHGEEQAQPSLVEPANGGEADDAAMGTDQQGEKDGEVTDDQSYSDQPSQASEQPAAAKDENTPRTIGNDGNKMPTTAPRANPGWQSRRELEQQH